MNHGTLQWGRPLETFFEIHLKLQQSIKLDRVGLVNKRPSPHYIHHFEKERKNVTPDTWHLKPNTWHLTPDTWHLTCDTGHVTNCGGWTFSHNFSSPALMVWDSQYLEDSELKDDVINEWMNYEAVYKTALATPGLLSSRSCDTLQKNVQCNLANKSLPSTKSRKPQFVW